MTSKQLRQLFFDFMASKGHSIIPSAPLVPKEDPTVLYVNSGMQPLVPYLLGIQDHPNGTRIANSQKCVRTGDIEEVGDNRHCTFFEMLGNWSIGDYFKDESIAWSLEFLTSKDYLGLDPQRIYVTTFIGAGDAPADEKSVQVWQQEFQKLGIQASVGDEIDFSKLTSTKSLKVNKITRKSAGENWWGLPYRGPCGGDTEIFYLRDSEPLDFETRVLEGLTPAQAEEYIDNNLIEIWNNVFMEYEGEWGEDGNPKDLKPLKNKNVDTGMGLERILAFMNGYEDVYQTDLLKPLVDVADKYSQK